MIIIFYFVVQQKNLQTESEQWNRNVDLLNLITYGQLLFIDGNSKRHVKMMYDGCMAILTCIGPLFKDEENVTRKNKDGSTVTIIRELGGINTRRFHIYTYNLSVANNHVVASYNTEYDRRTRHEASQEAYNILVGTGFNLLQDVNGMGFNSKLKNPGHNAGITGN